MSPEGEEVEIQKPVLPADSNYQVESWLLELEAQMTCSIQALLTRCIEAQGQSLGDEALRAGWLRSWPGQVILVASQQSWTARVEDALRAADPGTALSAALDESKDLLAQIASLVREA